MSDERSAPSRWRALATRAVLVIGVCAVALPLARSAPREQHLVLELPPFANVTQLSITYTRVGDLEPGGGIDFAVEPGKRRVERGLTLANGDYVVATVLRGPSGSHETSEVHRVTLDGTETKIALGKSAPR